jgi:hypothetical protein
LRDFLSRCFEKAPERRPSAAELRRHAWLRDVATPGTTSDAASRAIDDVVVEETVVASVSRVNSGGSTSGMSGGGGGGGGGGKTKNQNQNQNHRGDAPSKPTPRRPSPSSPFQDVGKKQPVRIVRGVAANLDDVVVALRPEERSASLAASSSSSSSVASDGLKTAKSPTAAPTEEEVRAGDRLASTVKRIAATLRAGGSGSIDDTAGKGKGARTPDALAGGFARACQDLVDALARERGATRAAVDACVAANGVMGALVGALEASSPAAAATAAAAAATTVIDRANRGGGGGGSGGGSEALATFELLGGIPLIMERLARQTGPETRESRVACAKAARSIAAGGAVAR